MQLVCVMQNHAVDVTACQEGLWAEVQIEDIGCSGYNSCTVNGAVAFSTTVTNCVFAFESFRPV